MRERLIELIHTFCKKENVLLFNKEILNKFADYLFADGWMRPPCKVGDTVYVNPKTWGGISFIHYDNLFIHSKYFLVAEVVSVIKTRKQNLIKLKVYNRTTYTPEYRRYPISSISKTVFLTKEGVIKALKGGAE